MSSFLAQSGRLDGLTGLNRGLVLDLTPVVTERVDGSPTGDSWTWRSARPSYGANVRWGVTPNLTLDGTVNPDFSQVEADASQFSFDPRSSLFFPEKRPFFLEGAELFAAPNDLIYTRRIVSPVAATKLAGRIAGTNAAVLLAADDSSTSWSGGSNHPIFAIARLEHDLPSRSQVGLVYTDRLDGADDNRVLAADARIIFGSIHSLQLQVGGSRTRTNGVRKSGPIWQAIFARDGHAFGYRYQVTGIHDDFQADSGFIKRGGIIHANVNHRVTLFGDPDFGLQSWTFGVQLDGIWQYKDTVVGDPWLEKKLHFNNNFTFKGGWRAGASALYESFAFDRAFYRDYAVQRVGETDAETAPFVGTPHLHNGDYVLTLNTPQFSRFSGSLMYLWGRDEDFLEWAPADIVFVNYSIDWRPSGKLRVSSQYQLQQFRRPVDGSLSALRRIPRLEVEYQVSRPVFLRVIAEYRSNSQDDLRDVAGTNLPLVVRDPATGTYTRQSAFEDNSLRMDALFSYQPTPGTVLFVGYGNLLNEPHAFRFDRLSRTSSGLFVKLSYLFRL